MSSLTDRILRNRLSLAADFFRTFKKKLLACQPPIEVVRDIMAMPPLEWQFHPLQGVIEAPALRANGTLITTPGYYRASALFYSPDASLRVPEIEEFPTRDHVEIAAEMILDVICDFPFVDPPAGPMLSRRS